MTLKILARTAVVGVLLGLATACEQGGGVTIGAGSDSQFTAPVLDADGDGVADAVDNCVDVANPDQTDVDEDAIGDDCDDLIDADSDLVGDDVDNCPGLENPEQGDMDTDGVGDLCDNCPGDANADQADDDSDGFGNLCFCDSCDVGEWCNDHPTQPTCEASCNAEQQCDDSICCPMGSRCDGGTCPLPDLSVSGPRLLEDLYIDGDFFAPDDCEVVEGCVQGTGDRTLLRFSTTTPNWGPGDLHLGDPDGFANFIWSPCHQHYHFESYAKYELVDAAGVVVAPGHKQAFCLMDFEPGPGGSGPPYYDCQYQGIQAHWADTYNHYLDCQFVDVTDVAPGDYKLRVSVNYEEYIAEADYTNNVTEVDVSF